MSDWKATGARAEADADPFACSPHAFARREFSLVVKGRRIALRQGTLAVGRSLSCDIVVNDRLVSREHAHLIVSESRLILLDLSSTNGLYVNGQRVSGSSELSGGDVVVIGTWELKIASDEHADLSTFETVPSLFGEPSASLQGELTERGMFEATEAAPPEASSFEATPVVSVPYVSARPTAARAELDPRAVAKADAFQVIGRLADRAMLMGNYEAAEQVIERHLTELVASARGGTVLPDSVREGAVRQALRLADVMRKPRWIDTAVEICLLARRPMNEWATARLVALVPQLPGVDREMIFYYQQVLRAARPHLGEADRALAEQIIALQPA